VLTGINVALAYDHLRFGQGYRPSSLPARKIGLPAKCAIERR
jgi:hypothetical protein